MNAGRAIETAAQARLDAERNQVTHRLNWLYEAIADGVRTAGLKTKLEETDAWLAEIEASWPPLPCRRCSCILS